jgi:hypothetical protein
MVLWSNVEDGSNINLERVAAADFLLQFRLVLEGEVADVNVILQCERELSIGKDSIFG